ncbi:Synaptosomal-associated protein 25 [Halotydeus destructor]|nr:Synaptosomal-associated protein 25 [Halotydeus destructor]
MPAEEPMGGGEPKSEYEMIQMKCDNVTDESLESTRRMLKLCEESKEAGIRTLVALDEQGEQIDKIDEDMDKIRADMVEAEKALAGMEQCCPCSFADFCPCLAKKVEYKEEDDDEQWKKDGKEGGPVAMAPNGMPMPAGSTIARITNDAREDEMGENMEQVNAIVGNLRNMALDMGQEIRAQNSQMKKMAGEADFCVDRISEANQRSAKLLRD